MAAVRVSAEKALLAVALSLPWLTQPLVFASVRFQATVSGAGVAGSVQAAFGVATSEMVATVPAAARAPAVKNSRR